MGGPSENLVEQRLDAAAEALFDLWERQLSLLMAGPPGFLGCPTDDGAAADVLTGTAKWPQAAAGLFKLWLVALSGHGLTALTGEAFSPHGKPATDAQSAAPSTKTGSGRGGNDQHAKNAGPIRAKRRSPRVGKAAKPATARAKAPRAASGNGGAGLDQPARRAAADRRGDIPVGASPGRTGGSPVANRTRSPRKSRPGKLRPKKTGRR